MAAQIPEKLKSADIKRFVTRAAQLENFRPVISYWCNYWVVNQILQKNLHHADEACLQYTTKLMDKLEKFKVENGENDAVTDDVAGQAYVEQFGLETFQRAENAMRANKATLQTADTLQAAAAFLELTNIWSTPEPEIAAKTKVAKFHAVRIAKAVKAGEDPNLSNPSIDVPKERESSGKEPEENPSSAVGAIPPPISPPTPPSIAGSRQATVEEDNDEDAAGPKRDVSGGARATFSEPANPTPSIPSSASTFRPPTSSTPVLPSTPGSASDRSELPSPPIHFHDTFGLNSKHVHHPSNLVQTFVPDLNLPAAPSDLPSLASARGSSPGIPQPHPIESAESLAPTIDNNQSTRSTTTVDSYAGTNDHIQQVRDLPPSVPTPPPTTLQSFPPPTTTRLSTATSLPPAHITPSAPPLASYWVPAGHRPVDDEEISQAQKHARWAISALSFDDVETAINELKISLRHLKA